MYTFEQLVEDLAMEIIYGCDRFDIEDITPYIVSFGRDNVREAVRTKIINADPNKESYNDDFLDRMLNFWIDSDTDLPF